MRSKTNYVHSTGVNKCSTNPCGENTRCQDVHDSFECTCLPGCSGDPLRGCICEGSASRTDYCKNTICGTNAQCRLQNTGDPQCYCPPEFPIGDPNVHCEYCGFDSYFCCRRFLTLDIN